MVINNLQQQAYESIRKQNHLFRVSTEVKSPIKC